MIGRPLLWRLYGVGAGLHDEKIISTFKRIYHIRDGRMVEERGEEREVAISP